MNAPRPSITIRVDARPGTDVRIDDKPVALDSSGVGAYSVDESAAAEGPADESRTVSVDLPYVVVPKGGPAEKGVASARVAVAPLRVDAPGSRAFVEESAVFFAGRAARGSTVTVDGTPVILSSDGTFEAKVALDALGDRAVEVRAGTTSLAPRTIHCTITRVASLADAAKQFEQRHPIGYDAAVLDIAGKTGQPIVADGEVLEARGAGRSTIVLVDDRRGCARGPCPARVIVGREIALRRGEAIRAYGVLARAFTASAGQVVPEIEAQFVIRAVK
jgi:hypothetical protein